MSKLVDMTGQKFGRWTVVERVTRGASGHTRWLCECVCGSTSIIHAHQLRQGRRTRCRRCFAADVTRARTMARSPISLQERYLKRREYMLKYQREWHRRRSGGGTLVRRKDLLGQRIGDWTVIADAGLTKFKKGRWLCRCACGTEQAVTQESLAKGTSTRCRSCSNRALWIKRKASLSDAAE